MTRQTPKFNSKKAKNVIFYLISKCGKMTKKKLTYLLFYLDMDYFECFEKTFMGFSYQKTKQGIKALELDNLLKELTSYKVL